MLRNLCVNSPAFERQAACWKSDLKGELCDSSHLLQSSSHGLVEVYPHLSTLLHEVTASRDTLFFSWKMPKRVQNESAK